ncbi:MFS transporter [Achromobacter piechaudii]|uniref:Fosfomycin resistance protein AbaF n=1 Tax=Achromobacter piechaudii TaxID=72556 RepID=A0A6S7D5W5_9BURK|nr:MFS transporter [Achromobacter piechaudii]CAB3868090.1 Fosfomycin resistance protein AbaF [Achromobacter piechaudii]
MHSTQALGGVIPSAAEDSVLTMTNAAKRRLVLSTVLGTTIEFFDVYIYGLAAGLYFAHVFFPTTSPVVGVIASFGTLASGFLIRPLGGVIGGHIGDRYGRKKVLVGSMILMGAATFVVGILPSYAVIGIWAPILLIIARLLQGLGAGAEWGGGVLMLVEHMSKDRRGLWGSFANFGIWLGIACGTLIFAGITRLSAETQEWIWRVPFLLSAVLVFVGLWVRVGVKETPLFIKAEKKTKDHKEKLPLAELLGKHKKATLTAIFIAAGAGSYQIYGTFATSYAGMLQLPMSTVLMFQFANGLVAMGLTVLFGWLSDLTGRRPLAIAGSLIVVPSMYALFWALNHAQLTFVLLSLFVLEIGHSMIYGPMGAYLAEQFDTRTRYTGVSLAYQIGAGAISGMGPLLASSLLAAAGGPPNVYTVPLIVVGFSAMTIIGAIMAPERARQHLPT